MASEQHLDILNQGVATWNRWREQNPEVRPDLERANLSGRNLTEVNLSNANLDFARLHSVNLAGANLDGAGMYEANLSPTPIKRGESRFVPTNLSNATLIGARLHNAFLGHTQFVCADLTDAQLWDTDAFAANFYKATLVRTEVTQARLHYTRFKKANLIDTYLWESSLIETDFEGATLIGCNVYGISAWDLNLYDTTQAGLVITPPSTETPQPTITVDDLEVAQFIYLLINNQNIRRAIDTIISKVVLILGRFTEERKPILDAIKQELRNRDYLPVLFDFEGPENQTPTETVSTLARLSRFIIADLTDPRSAPHELATIVPSVRRPVQPIIWSRQREYGMFSDLRDYQWLLDIHPYDDLDHLKATLDDKVIATAEAKAAKLKV